MPQGRESRAVQPGAVIVECQTPTGPLRLAISAEALPGLRSWLQAAPPTPAKPGPPSPDAPGQPPSGVSRYPRPVAPPVAGAGQGPPHRWPQG